ncbi:M48 family metalloprotease [Haloferax larsenii]|nr:M48 family metalloprotease [Haloferax larsenii]
MDWSPSRRLQLRMAASLAALAVCVLAVGIASGVVVSLMLVSAGLVSEFIVSISQVTSVRFAGAIIGGCTLLVLSLAVWGEREAPTHAIASIGARRADESEYPALFAVVDGVCRQADAPRPTIYLVPSDSPLSFTTGFTPQTARLVVSEQLLDCLDADELEAVVAHEISHVKNRDVSVMTAAALPIGAAHRVVTLLSGPTPGVEHGQVSRADLPDLFLTLGLGLVLPVWLCAHFLAASLSRAREFAADRGAVAITGHPTALATALQTIDDELPDRPESDIRTPELSAFAIVEPDRTGANGLFSGVRKRLRRPFETHPRIETRLERLRAMARSQERSD